MQALPQVVENLECGVLGLKTWVEIRTFPHALVFVPELLLCLMCDRLGRKWLDQPLQL